MPNAVLTEAIDRLADGENLSAADAARVLREVMEGSASDAEAAALLIALRAKGETVEEIAGLARTMRELATPVEVDGAELVDTAGTGGGPPTFNVSTTAAFVAAGAGCRVAKHGNRSATSRCGSADVLEALGARIDLSPEAVADCIESVGFGFMFAPNHHQAMRYVVPVRKELAVRTVFNLLGPLTNPAGASRQLVGVPRPEFTELMARALMLLGTKRAWVVHGADGIDELTTTGYTKISECRDGAVNTFYLHPADVGLPKAPPGSLHGGDAHENARTIEAILGGTRGPARDVVLLNAGASLFIAGAAVSVDEGILKASRAIDRGDARRTLERLVSISTAEEFSGGASA
jgi:anthranilate phosphoribosyltransferase